MPRNNEILDEEIGASKVQSFSKLGSILEAVFIGGITIGLLLKYFNKPYYSILTAACGGMAVIYLFLSWFIFAKGEKNIVKTILSIISGIALAWFCMDLIILEQNVKEYTGLIYWGTYIILGAIVLNGAAYFVLRGKYDLHPFSWNIISKLFFAFVMQEFLKMGMLFY